MASYLTPNSARRATNFLTEISNMMHGFGDNPNPNAATVSLVENIVRKQLRSLLLEADRVAEAKGSTIITNAEIIFLMRKNLVKLRRLRDYQQSLDFIDQKCNVQVNVAKEMLLLVRDDAEPVVVKKRTHIDVIRELDAMDEVGLVNLDAIEYFRKVRADRLSEAMPFEQYEQYHRARCSSFRNSQDPDKVYVKLEKWLNPNKELRITFSALEVLAFLGYETVAELVDAVYLLRQDTDRDAADPLGKFAGDYFLNPQAANNAANAQLAYKCIPEITVAEIREAVRRFFNPNNTLSGLFYRNMGMDLPQRFIAL